jgi:glycerophosphoryl diester phosphodiesterase
VTAFASSPLVVGHRGGRGEGWPAENTLASFERAKADGATAIELDVRTCGSGEVIVFHDATLARMTAGTDARAVADVAWSDLRHIALVPSGERAPLLEDALAWAEANDVAVNVELKHDVPDRPKLARRVASSLARVKTDVLVSSFDPVLLVAMAAFAPRVRRAYLAHAEQGRWSRALLEASRAPAIFALHVERRQTSPGSIARWKARGLRVGVWTVNDAREAVDLVALGVDFVITDRAREVLGALAVAVR